ncbi:diacylglycerol kinase [Streptomyces morookaense]|uniref:Diacylglycerol kinase n=1 Tax=Streptomyces morookaense TaxID=1970 RepID=A0A7Y7B100_STRMO|nr:diacylglycerol kinase [Streptomyces morookaense]NVK76917.1 diacylglycerol kinase [Streptomyces morookaense]GHF25590.1 diacylglycerol kinase [Streptomyces morookaense]
MSAADPAGQRLLVVVDPVARRVDGESVRIARDVLCAGSMAKICLPESPEEVARAVGRRGRRRTVVIGDDRALLRVVALLHRQRELAAAPLAWVPVGSLPSVSVARVLGVPLGAVAAARAVLDGVERRFGLLADDSDGIVLGGLWVPASEAGRRCAAVRGVPGAAVSARSALALLTRTGPRRGPRPGARLRVEADGVLLATGDRPVGRVAVSAPAGGGLAEVIVHPRAGHHPVRAAARTITVSGPDFRYRADNRVRGPVRARTWTALGEGWRLTVPRA